jgi:hypothetical protein
MTCVYINIYFCLFTDDATEPFVLYVPSRNEKPEIRTRLMKYDVTLQQFLYTVLSVMVHSFTCSPHF